MAIFRSIIKKHFSVELLVELEKLTRRFDINNNDKSVIINQMMTDAGIPYSKLGCGTNRYGISIDGYALKIALDKLGKMDNKREFKYSPILYPDAVKVYESLPTGLISVSEYVTSFDKDMFYNYQDNMRKILSRVCEEYLVGDVGISSNNYMNWGVRDNGEICMLDFAYIYSMRSNSFMCTACQSTSFMEYDDDFNYLICPDCHKKYAFKEMRKRISDVQEASEIGDIRELGYVLTESSQDLDVDPSKSIFMKNKNGTDKKLKKKSKKQNASKEEHELDEEDSYSELDELDTDDKIKLILGGN